jgi:hypothetical protein
MKIIVHALPRKKSGGQIAPLAACPVQIQNAVQDGSQIMFAFPLAGQDIIWNFPLGIGQLSELGLHNF